MPALRRKLLASIQDALILAVLIGALTGVSRSRAEDALDPTPSVAPPQAIQEVIVEAAEPRYVAPTRHDRIGRIWAPVMINGRGPFRLVLDTGANASAINEAVAQTLGLIPSNGAMVTLQGVTGTRPVAAVTVNSFVIGDLALRPARIPVIADAFGGADGVLGTDGLQDKRIIIEFKRDRITIVRSHGERARAGFMTIPVRMIGGLMALADARIGGLPVTAILDTGGQSSIANPALAAAIHYHRPNTQSAGIIGATLDETRGELMETPQLTTGDLRVHLNQLIVADAYIFGYWKLNSKPVILLGMDVLGWLDTLIIDYRRHELQVKLTHG